MNKQINITEIPKRLKFKGYIWMSDSEKPIMFAGDDFQSCPLGNISDSSNPFIIEGQLYADREQKSYSIKYADGKHIVVEYDLSKAPKEVIDKEFIPNRLQNVAKIKFRQYWKTEADKYCENMETLKPASYVFVGFEYSSNKEKEEK